MLFYSLVLRPKWFSGTVLMHTRAIGVNYVEVSCRWSNYYSVS